MQNYNPNIYYNYGYDWFRLSGGGHQVAWGVHHFDIVNWAMGVKYPKRVSAMGGHFAYQDNFEYPNTFDAIMEFGPGPGRQERIPAAIHDADGIPPRPAFARQVFLWHRSDDGA